MKFAVIVAFLVSLALLQQFVSGNPHHTPHHHYSHAPQIEQLQHASAHPHHNPTHHASPHHHADQVVVVPGAASSAPEGQQPFPKYVPRSPYFIPLSKDLPGTWSYGQNNYTMQTAPNQPVRELYVYVPQSYQAGTAVTLILALHGLGDDPLDFAAGGNFTNLSEERGFILAYPQGFQGLLGTGWNAGTCCIYNTIDDKTFLTEAIQAINQTFSIRPESIHSCGFSNGGFMTETLACTFPEIFRSAASVSGDDVMVWGGPQALAACDAAYKSSPGTPLSMLHVHGNADMTVPITGNPLLGWPSIHDDLAAWAVRNNCPSQPVHTLNISTFSNWVYQNCDGNAQLQVEFVLNNGGGHEWPMIEGIFETTNYILDFFDRATPGGI